MALCSEPTVYNRVYEPMSCRLYRSRDYDYTCTIDRGQQLSLTMDFHNESDLVRNSHTNHIICSFRLLSHFIKMPIFRDYSISLVQKEFRKKP